MVAFQRKDTEKYTMECSLVDVNKVCNLEKTFPADWITEHGTDIGPEFLAYALPLIQGDVSRQMEDGIPQRITFFCMYIKRRRPGGASVFLLLINQLYKKML